MLCLFRSKYALKGSITSTCGINVAPHFPNWDIQLFASNKERPSGPIVFRYIEHDATNRNPICQHEEQFECLLLYTPHLGTKKLIFCLSDSRPACDSLTIRGLQLPFPSMPIVYHIALIFDDWQGSLY